MHRDARTIFSSSPYNAKIHKCIIIHSNPHKIENWCRFFVFCFCCRFDFGFTGSYLLQMEIKGKTTAVNVSCFQEVCSLCMYAHPFFLSHWLNCFNQCFNLCRMIVILYTCTTLCFGHLWMLYYSIGTMHIATHI